MGLACVGVPWVGVLGRVAIGFFNGVRFIQWVLLGVCGVGFLLVVLLGGLGLTWSSRRFEYAAHRRGAVLLGSTEPLKALSQTVEQDDRDAWWVKLYSPDPYPADHLAALEDVDAMIEQDTRMYDGLTYRFTGNRLRLVGYFSDMVRAVRTINRTSTDGCIGDGNQWHRCSAFLRCSDFLSSSNHPAER